MDVYYFFIQSDVKCTYKQDPIVTCSLGNPLRTNKHLHLLLRFETADARNHSKIGSEDELRFEVFVNSTSEELSKSTRALLTAIVNKKAEVKLSR